MHISLLPNFITDELSDLTPDLLKAHGTELLMMDFDNTVVPYTTDIPQPRVTAWFERMKKARIRLCVVSNSHNDRVRRFCSCYGLECIVRAGKPGTRGIRACLEKFGVSPARAALVGDQIFTDTLGGNLAGVTTILVRAIDNHNIWLKLRHVLELPFIFAAGKRRIGK